MHYRRPLAILIASCLISCTQEKTKEPEAVAPPSPTYQGPEFLHGTLGSLATIGKGQNKPILVSGYGLVVGLNGTGSSDCPPQLRQWVINEMSRGGFGSAKLNLRDRTPEAELASGRVAVVFVEGIIPAGASKGTRFDLMVSALPQSSVTSLEDGVLYTTDLKVNGLDLATAASSSLTALGRGGGPIFVNPFLDSDKPSDDFNDPRRVGRVLAGGFSLADMPLQLVLARPSLRLVTQVTERINSRILPDKDDGEFAASAASESTINLRVPRRFRGDPQRLLDLVSHIYLDPSVQNALAKAEGLAAALGEKDGERFADDVAYTWEAMGRAVVPVLRRYYMDHVMARRMAALQAGARLEDSRAVEPLLQIAKSDDSQYNLKAAARLGEMLTANRSRPNPALAAHLRKLLDHDDTPVRIAAFEALNTIQDPSIESRVFDEKLQLVRVASEKPLIYIARTGRPRIVIFGEQVGFPATMLATIWNDRLMLRTSVKDPKLQIYYRQTEGAKALQDTIPADLHYLVGTMAFRPKGDSTTRGLNLGYGRIVQVLSKLTDGGYVQAPIVMQPSDLGEQIRKMRITDPEDSRPESAKKKTTDGELKTVAPAKDSGDNGRR